MNSREPSTLAPLGFTLAGVGFVAAYLVLAPSHSTELLAAGAMAFAAAAIGLEMLVHRPVRPVPWVLLAVGLAGVRVARLVAAAEWYGDTGFRFPGGGEAWGALAFPALLVGTVSDHVGAAQRPRPARRFRAHHLRDRTDGARLARCRAVSTSRTTGCR